MTVVTIPFRQTCSHEAYHCSALLIRSIPIQLVRVDRPVSHGETLAGFTRIDWGAIPDPFDPDVLRAVMTGVLVGCLVEGFTPGAHHWPIRECEWPTEAARDAAQVDLIGRMLEIDRVSFGQIAFGATRLARTRVFRELAVAVSRALQRDEVVFGHELQIIAHAILGAGST